MPRRRLGGSLDQPRPAGPTARLPPPAARHVLCSLLDPDPALGVNRACAEAFPAEIVAAVAALARLTGAGRAWLAVDADADPAAWAGVRRVAAESAGDLRLVPVDNDYPQPDPTLLLYALTGRRLPPGRLPTDRGVLLLDAAAAAAVGRALAAGEPMLRVPFAVHDRTGAAIAEPDRARADDAGADDAGASRTYAESRTWSPPPSARRCATCWRISASLPRRRPRAELPAPAGRCARCG